MSKKTTQGSVEMEGNKLSSQLKKDVRLLIIKERLFKLNESIRNNLLDDGYEFELKELFVDSEWKEVAVWPANGYKLVS